jgi:hypothetical protein
MEIQMKRIKGNGGRIHVGSIVMVRICTKLHTSTQLKYGESDGR